MPPAKVKGRQSRKKLKKLPNNRKRKRSLKKSSKLKIPMSLMTISKSKASMEDTLNRKK